MKQWHYRMIRVAAISAAWCMQTNAKEAVLSGPEPIQIQPVPIQTESVRLDPARPAAAVDAAWNSFEFVFTGKLDDVKYGPVGQSFPPVYSVQLTFTIEKSIRGSLKAGEKVTLHHSARQHDRPTYPDEDGAICLVGAMTGDHGAQTLGRIEKSGPGKLASVVTACELPLGWSMTDGKAVSPWAVLGEAVWPKAAGNLGATVVCAKSGRPALLCGGGIEMTVKPVPPAKSIQWTNPDGDGDYEITVSNKSGGPLKVPALLTDGKDLQWANSLAILCQGKAYPAPACKTGLAKLEPAELQPGQSVTGTVNALALSGPDWPQGGSRISFQFCMGEKSVSHSFYYMSRHHDAIRDAQQKANPLPAAPAIK
ncbi:MAG: hypothetical protein NTW21_43645 [Verrucomicrobia bacterium]|nr:hypothetical protein [Verrucomicrobiota bacterium]